MALPNFFNKPITSVIGEKPRPISLFSSMSGDASLIQKNAKNIPEPLRIVGKAYKDAIVDTARIGKDVTVQLLTLIPRTALQTYANLTQKEIKLPFDQKNLGIFKGAGKKIEPTGKMYAENLEDMFDPNLSVPESFYRLVRNSGRAIADVGADILDVIGTGQVVKDINKYVLKKIPAPDAEHNFAFKSLGGGTKEQALKNADDILKDISPNSSRAVRNGTVNEELAKTVTTFRNVIEKQGVPKDLNLFPKIVRKTAETLDTPVSKLFKGKIEPQTPFVKPAGLLQESNQANPSEVIQSHISEAKDVLVNLPEAEIQKLGGVRALIDSAKKNIVDGLVKYGLKADAANIQAMQFSSLQQLESALVKRGILQIPITANLATNPLKFLQQPVAEVVPEIQATGQRFSVRKLLSKPIEEVVAPKPQGTDISTGPGGGDISEYTLPKAEAEQAIRKLFSPEEMDFVVRKQFLNPMMEGRFTPENFYSDNARALIEVVESNGNVSNRVVYHEAFHAYLNKFLTQTERNDVFEKARKNKAVQLSLNKYDKEIYPTEELRIEEFLADDFARYVAGKSEFKTFFGKIWEKILNVIRNWIRRTTNVQKVYEDLISRRKTAGSQIPVPQARTGSMQGVRVAGNKRSLPQLETQPRGMRFSSKAPSSPEELGGTRPNNKTETESGKAESGDSKLEQAKKALQDSEKKASKLGMSPKMQALQEAIEGIDLEDLALALKNRNLTEDQISQASLEVALKEEAIENMPVKGLVKYVSPKTGRLPEVTGKETMQAISGSGKTVKTSEFGRRGDDIVTEFGFNSAEEAQNALEIYQKTAQQLKDVKERLREIKRKKFLAEKGQELMRIAMSERRSRFRNLKSRYKLVDSELADLRQKRDLSAMTDKEFQDFMVQAEIRAGELEARRDARIQVQATIAQNELKKVENLQKALGLPPIAQMTTKQLQEFDEILSQYQFRDEFLGVRKLETIDKTALAGSKTYREARIKLAKKLGMKIEDLNAFQVSELDRFRWDTALAEKNPFYRLAVENFNAALLEGETRYLDLENKVNKMMNRLRKGTSFINRLVPTDERIFSYLEASPEEKASIAKTMTNQEYQAAEFFRDEFSRALQYEYDQQIIHKSRFEDSYITHIRRDYLEAIKTQLQQKDNPLKAVWIATQELFEKYKDDFAVFNILDQKTGQILPMEKFFKYAMYREGNMKPSKNVAKAFMSYMRIFETKKALDKVIPEIMTYVDVLTPRKFTEKGLEMDDRLKTFITEYLNNKKGRRAKLAVTPGGKVDGGVRAAKSLVTLLDLGLNLVTQLASHGGAQASVLIDKGFSGWLRGWKREFMPKYRAIAKKHENYTGRPPWKNLADSTKGLASKTKSLLFYMFQSANVWAKKIHLLSSITEAELKAGEVSPQRLSQLQNELGRWFPVEKAESIIGSTAEGAVATQYRKWAIAPMRTFVKNVAEYPSIVKETGKDFWKDKRSQELVRVGLLTGLTALFAFQLGVDEDQKDDSATMRLIRKTLQDVNSGLAGLDPKTWSSPPRLISFVTDLAKNFSTLIRLEEYKTSGKDFEKGDLKGPKALERMLTPAIVKNIKTFTENAGKSGENQTPSLKSKKIKLIPKKEAPVLKSKSADRKIKLKRKESSISL